MSSDLRMLKSFHESAHVVSSYLLGRSIDIVSACGSNPRMQTGRVIGDIRNRAEAEDEIVILLSGAYSSEELVFRNVGGSADRRLAGEIAIYVSSTVDEAVRVFDRASARTRRLVSSPRFQNLTIALAVELAEVPAMSGRRASELLASWDPAPVASGVRGATLEQFAASHPSAWAAAKLAAMTSPMYG